MSDEELDIGANLVAESSDSESENEEVQDVILSDNEEKAPAPEKPKSFPVLEQGDSDDEQFIASVTQQANRNNSKSKGSFAAFGLSKGVLANIRKKGYNQPTPIQRKAMPLVMDGRDVVGMARTGSGKTAAFLLPLVEKMKTHSQKVGIRAVVLSPTRELAMQTYREMNDFSRGFGLRNLLLVGGDSLEDQFTAMSSNPDVVIATPGRFLHLKVEMKLDLRTVEYIVYDEADRLFEMGFSEQLNELLASLPERRQSLLFSATLPRNLVDFAKAGLQNPVLVRLDAESKISDNLQMAFLSTKKNEKEAMLLYLLEDVIKMPPATEEQKKKLQGKMDESDGEDETPKKKKSKKNWMKPAKASELPSERATIVFVPTKHHVDLITGLLTHAGFCVAYIYGSLDQYARRRQLLAFRSGVCSILVVTDVAARGIDIPILANVINFAFPTTPKLFVHRVGRTARAGHSGWAYSIVCEDDLPYLLDLEVFLGRKVLLTRMQEKKAEILKKRGSPVPEVSYTSRLVLGGAPRAGLGDKQETYEMIMKSNYDLVLQRGVCERAEKALRRTRQAASAEGARRAKEIVLFGWEEQNLLFGANQERAKDEFLAKLQNRKHKETVFEFNGADDYLMDLMAKRRHEIAPIEERARKRRELLEEERSMGLAHKLEDEIERRDGTELEVGFDVKEEELAEAFEDADSLRKRKKTYRDPGFYLSHYAPSGNAAANEELSLSGGSGGSEAAFSSAAASASFGIDGDDSQITVVQKQKVSWDKNKKNYVKKQDDRRYIIGENGQRIPASFRSGKYEEWKKKNRSEGYKVGITESGSQGNALTGRKVHGKYMHRQSRAPQRPDKARNDYSKQVEKVKKALGSGKNVKGFRAKGTAPNELRTTDQIRKQREQKEKRRAKNGRPRRR